MRLCRICQKPYHGKLRKGQYCVPPKQKENAVDYKYEKKDPMTLQAIQDEMIDADRKRKNR